MTKEEKAAKKAAKLEALKKLKEYAEKTQNKEALEALKVIKPSLFGVTKAKTDATFVKFVNYIVERRQASEEELFKNFKVGRKEAHAMLRKYLKKVNAANRVWIELEPSKGLYIVKGQGATPPAGWQGFVPVDIDKK